MTININYEEALKNHVRADAEKAIQLFLSGSPGTVIAIFPQALNPVLKALESLCIWKQAIVIPYSDANKPIYILVKVGKNEVSQVEVAAV